MAPPLPKTTERAAKRCAADAHSPAIKTTAARRATFENKRDTRLTTSVRSKKTMKRPAAASTIAPKKPKKDYPAVGTVIEAK